MSEKTKRIKRKIQEKIDAKAQLLKLKHGVIQKITTDDPLWVQIINILTTKCERREVTNPSDGNASSQSLQVEK